MRKELFLIFIFCGLIFSARSQQLRPTVEVNRSFGKALSHEKLSHPKTLEEIIPYYPKNWIQGYRGTTVTIVSKGITKSAEGKSEMLSPNQIKMLEAAAVGDQITFQIRYQSLNSVTEALQNDVLDLRYTVVADEEAQPAQGTEFLKTYFENQAFKKITASKTSAIINTGAPFLGATVTFVVDETGRVTATSLKQSSGNKEADQLLLETLQRMPAWKPAQNRDGKSFSQQFTLTVINAGC